MTIVINSSVYLDIVNWLHENLQVKPIRSSGKAFYSRIYQSIIVCPSGPTKNLSPFLI